MKDREFVYWLMGFFELAEPRELTQKQVNCVHAHLKLVLANTKDEITIPFVYWLEGVMNITPEGGWSNSTMNLVIERLQKVFKHVIDLEPSEEQQSIFNNIHGPDKDGGILRC